MPQQDETQQDESPPVAEDPRLSPGMAFRLQPDGSWDVEKLPHPVLDKAKFSGYLTILGYRCSVFETPDGSMWAQKSTNIPVNASIASRVADAWLHSNASAENLIVAGDVIDINNKLPITPQTVGFPIGVRPSAYLIRIDNDSYVLVSFPNNIDNLFYEIEKAINDDQITSSEVIKELQDTNIDVSVWMKDDGGDDIEWVHGKDISPEYLKSIEAQTNPAFKPSRRPKPKLRLIKSSEPDMSIKCPDCGGKAVDVRSYSACCPKGHFFSVKPKMASIEPKWVKPSIDDELPELERISSEEGFDLERLKLAFASAVSKNLSEDDWSRLENSDSYGVESISQAESLAKGYGRDLANLVRGFQAGSPMKMPVVLELDDGTITLVGGNTRLMAARVLDISPKVLWVSTFDKGLNPMNTIASRAASVWLSKIAGSDDIVSQVTEILEEGGLGDGEDNDYDDDIVKWCEKIQDKIPEMQEIFDEAFHQVMDFKDKVPVSDNPRVRQIADDKIAGMLNESAARLEIISHGLVKEIQSLCSGLAAGASKVKKESSTKVKKESSMKPSQLASQLRRIASAIDNSKNPDRTLVSKDLKKVIAALQPNHGLSIEDPKYWEEVADQLIPTLESAEFMSEGVELLTGQELEKESKDHGYYFSLVVSKSQGKETFGVQVSFEGDADYAWTGPKDNFEFTNPIFLAGVAKRATDMARSMMGL